MKLTKAQRLFVAIGHADKRILSESVRGFMPPTQKEKFSIVKQELKQLRARRKKLIREALEEAQRDWCKAVDVGWSGCKEFHNISD